MSIVETAKEYLGTPWHHAGRTKGVGVDCIGLIVCALRDTGVEVEDFVNYTEGDEYAQLLSRIPAYADEVPWSNNEYLPGDILIFRGRKMYNHCAIYSGMNYMIHANRHVGVVVETYFSAGWQKWYVGRYRLKQS